MPKRTVYQKTLDRLASLLRSRPRTAREIADKMKCCRPTAYQRLEGLRARGEEVYMLTGVAKGATGPRATAYGLR